MNGEKYRLPDKKLADGSIKLFAIRKGIDYVFKDVKKVFPDDVINVIWDEESTTLSYNSETVSHSSIYAIIYSKHGDAFG